MKMVINGETILLAIIPIGLKEEKNFNERGIVKNWAPQEAAREDDKAFGKKHLLNKYKKYLEKISIPASAP